MAKYYNPQKRKAAQKYLITQTLSVAFRLNRRTDGELIEIYERIPNKSQFFKQALKEWDAKNR